MALTVEQLPSQPESLHSDSKQESNPQSPKPPAELASYTNKVDDQLSSAFATVEIPVDILGGGGREEGKKSDGDDDLRRESIRSEHQNFEYHPSSSSSSSSRNSTGDGDNDYYDDEYDDDGLRVTGTASSSRSSISSLPGSVVVHPRDKLGAKHYSNYYDDGYENGELNGSGNGDPGFMKFIPRVRDRESPFRHPSSVRAMQMNDGDDDEFSTPPRFRKPGPVRTPRFSETSRPSITSPQSSSSKRYSHRSPNNQSPTKQNIKKEYPLVLLHCNLLPPSLSLPAGINVPNPRILKDVLPSQYWRRWKLLEDKIVGAGVVQDRGVLISHPQEAYDMLEERLLESLELVAPRLGNGHFLGGEDEPDDDEEELEGDTRESELGAGHSENHQCPDCGTKVVRDPDGGGRKWEIKVYAANGLMKAGAWSAAWREMERVDVEVRVWLPEEVRRDLEARIHEEDAMGIEEELRQSEEDKRTREVYGSPNGSQIRLDTSFGERDMPQYTPEEFEAPSRSPLPQQEPAIPKQDLRSGPEVDLQTLLFNYFRLLARDSRNVIIGFLGVLVLFLAVNSGRPTVNPTETMLPEVIDVVAPPAATSVAQYAPSIQSTPMEDIAKPIVQAPPPPVYEAPAPPEEDTKPCVSESSVHAASASPDKPIEATIVPEPPVNDARAAADEAIEFVVPEANVDEPPTVAESDIPVVAPPIAEDEETDSHLEQAEMHNDKQTVDEPADNPSEEPETEGIQPELDTEALDNQHN